MIHHHLSSTAEMVPASQDLGPAPLFLMSYVTTPVSACVKILVAPRVPALAPDIWINQPELLNTIKWPITSLETVYLSNPRLKSRDHVSNPRSQVWLMEWTIIIIQPDTRRWKLFCQSVIMVFRWSLTWQTISCDWWQLVDIAKYSININVCVSPTWSGHTNPKHFL